MKSNLFITRSKKILKLWMFLGVAYLFWIIFQRISNPSGVVGYSNIGKEETGYELFIDIITMVTAGAIACAEAYRIMLLYKEYVGFIKSYRREEKLKKIIRNIKYILISIMILVPISWFGGFCYGFDIFSMMVVIALKGAFLYYFKQLIDFLSR